MQDALNVAVSYKFRKDVCAINILDRLSTSGYWQKVSSPSASPLSWRFTRGNWISLSLSLKVLNNQSAHVYLLQNINHTGTRSVNF